jgi:hypothetical protein
MQGLYVFYFVFPEDDFVLATPLPACSPLYIKSGSKWQSGLNMGIFAFRPVFGNRSYWGIFDHIFSDTVYTGLESEITNFAGRKTGLISPFWLADRRSDGLE